MHPIHEDDPLVGVGAYGESKIEAEEVTRDFGRRGLDFTIVRPKTFIGPERLGVFEILFDWIRDSRRIYMLGDGREPLPAARGRGSRRRDRPRRASGRRPAGETVNVGAKEFGTVREDLQALIDHAGSSSRLTPVPGAAGRGRAARARARSALSPLAEWHYKTAHRDSFVAIDRAEELLGWTPRSRTPRRCAARTTGTSRTATRSRAAGVTHRVPWNQQALGLLKKIS